MNITKFIMPLRKTCFRCKSYKIAIHFSPKQFNKEKGICKECQFNKKKDTHENIKKFRWGKNIKYMHEAHKRTAKAIKNGELIKEACVICGKIRVDAHHEDYREYTKVVWLCPKHHAQWHGCQIEY